MEQFVEFFKTYGLWLTLIAVAGVIILGILKYCKVFDKFSEKIRHLLYLVISVGISIVGSIIYLACVHQLDVVYVLTLAGAILAVNQLAYTIYDSTPLRELLKKLWELIKSKLPSKKAQTIAEGVEDVVENIVDAVEEKKKETEQSEQKEEQKDQSDKTE